MILFLIGVLSGIIGGMGIGGGTILIPAITIFGNVDQHMAQSINLLVFIPMAITSLIIHYKNHNLILKVILSLIPGGVIGSILGAYIAVWLSSLILKKMFAVFLLLIGLYEIFYKKQYKKENH